MKKIFFMLLVIIKSYADNNSNYSDDERSQCKIYDRVYAHFNLTLQEKRQLESELKKSQTNYVYYSNGSGFYYPNATKSDISRLEKICEDNEEDYYYYPNENSSQRLDSSYVLSSTSNSNFTQIDDNKSLDKNQETFLQNSFKPLTRKNLAFHSMMLKSHS